MFKIANLDGSVDEQETRVRQKIWIDKEPRMRVYK
jgi:hypothetical protein